MPFRTSRPNKGTTLSNSYSYLRWWISQTTSNIFQWLGWLCGIILSDNVGMITRSRSVAYVSDERCQKCQIKGIMTRQAKLLYNECSFIQLLKGRCIRLWHFRSLGGSPCIFVHRRWYSTFCNKWRKWTLLERAQCSHTSGASVDSSEF